MRVIPAFALACLALLSGGELAAQASARWYIGTYTNDLLVWDDASEQVVQRIRMRNPIPGQITTSESKQRLYVRDASRQFIEVVDVAAGQVVDMHTLSEGSTSVRIGAFAPHPDDRKAVMTVRSHTKGRDRYTIEGPFVVEYDLQTKEVTDTVPLPDGRGPANINYRYSPDGRTLYFFTDDIVAVDAETYEEVDRWELSQPIEPGLGATAFGTASGAYDQPGVATALFRMTDPAQNRRLMGVSRTRLSEREVDFFVLGPNEPIGSFVLAPDGTKAYSLYSEIGRYEFWEIDLVNRRVSRRQPFAGRPRMGLQVSADGEKLYVHVAGNTIDVYDSATFELLRTVALESDMTGGVAVIPGARPAP